MAGTLRYRDATLRVAILPRLCVVRWFDSPQLHHFPEIVAAMKAAGEGGGAGLFNVVDGGGKLPSFGGGVREAASEFARELTPLSVGAAHIILVGGLTGTAVRMFLSTLTLLSRSKAPTTIHTSVADGAAWMAKHLGQGMTTAQIDAVFALTDPNS